MPTYDYACENCKHAFEKYQLITAKVTRKCPKCGKLKLVRLIGAGSGILFKGGGWPGQDITRRNQPKPDVVKPKLGENTEAPKRIDGGVE